MPFKSIGERKQMTPLIPLIKKVLPSMVELRRHFHAYPEPGFQEYETSKKISGILEKISGIEMQTNMAETGIVAILGRRKSGPCVALRADMDALPIPEMTGKPYASKNVKYMHACGHDGHMACLVGAVLVLAEIQDELQGPVKFIFQPAEECGGGARKMCDQGVLSHPEVEAIFGLHVHHGRNLQLGGVGVCSRSAMAGSGNFRIEIHGKGGHAAYPHLCKDPVFIGMQVGIALQAIVSRFTNPVDSAVITVSKFHAGTAVNIIPDTSVLEGTFRSLSPRVLKQIAKQIETTACRTARMFGADADVIIHDGYPVLVNHIRSTTVFKKVAEQVVPPALLKLDFPPLMGCEDFAYYAEKIPATFWFLGIRPPDVSSYPPCHHPSFDFNDDALAAGIQMHCEIARQFVRFW